MVLYLIGLGLGDLKDITIKGMEMIQKCQRVYLEHYTSILLETSVEDMARFYGVPEVRLADRELVESGAEEDLLEPARTENVALLVVGDPFGATTHTDLVLRARQLGIPVEVVHNSSIMNAVACCGLQLYNFGQTVSMVFFTESWRPDSFYDRVRANLAAGMHTLVLLDIKVKEQSLENLLKGRKIYEPPRYMTVAQCAQQLLEVEATRGEGVYTPDTLSVGLARVGRSDQYLLAAPLRDLAEADMGPPLHSLVIVCEKSLHPLELEFLDALRTKKE